MDTLAYTAFPSALTNFHSSIMPALVRLTTQHPHLKPQTLHPQPYTHTFPSHAPHQSHCLALFTD